MKTFQFNQKPSVANLAIETKHCNCDMMTFFENKSENSEKNSEKSKHRVKEFIYFYFLKRIWLASAKLDQVGDKSVPYA